jgi:glutathione S-transferase
MARAFDMPALYHWEPNTFSLKPLIALNEKKVEFESRYVDFLAFEHAKIPATDTTIESAHNPEGEGPVLVHKGVAMSESFFICLYLDEAFPEVALRPKDAYGRWRVLAWARFVNEVLSPAVSTLGCHAYLAPALKKRDRASVERAVEKLPALEQRNGWLAALDDSYSEDLLADSKRKLGIAVKKTEDALAQSEWLIDGVFSLADIDAFSLLNAAPKLAPDIVNGQSSPKTMAWLDKIRNRPAVRAAFAAAKTSWPDTAFTPGPEHSRWG